jgi:hypothetical protein
MVIERREQETWLRRNLVAIVGFAINLLMLGAFIGRQSQIIETMDKRQAIFEQRVTSHHEDMNVHTTAEWRGSVLQKLDRLDGKLDAHILSGDKRGR